MCIRGVVSSNQIVNRLLLFIFLHVIFSVDFVLGCLSFLQLMVVSSLNKDLWLLCCSEIVPSFYANKLIV